MTQQRFFQWLSAIAAIATIIGLGVTVFAPSGETTIEVQGSSDVNIATDGATVTDNQ